PAPQSISTATESGTTVTITTAGAHGFARGQTVTVTGVSVAGYNGTFTITSVTGTTFTYTDSTSGLASGSGGNAQVGFTIAVHPPQTGNVPTLNYSSPDGGLTWIVIFSGAGVAGNSIGDGVYDILLNQSAVTYNYSGATLTQCNRATDTFYRLFGDSNGDQRVNNTDLARFSNSFASTVADAAYLPYFDFNADGRINNSDLNQFSKRFGINLSGFTPTI